MDLTWKHILQLIVCSVFCSCAARGYHGSSANTSRIYFKPEGKVSLFKKTVDNTTQGNFELGIDVDPGIHQGSVEYEIKQPCPMYSLGCIEEIAIGECKFTITTEASSNYEVHILGSLKDASIKTINMDTNESSGEGSCSYTKDAFDAEKYRKLPRAY